MSGDALPDAPLRERFRLDVSAASGLVLLADIAHVVADDGLRLHRFRLDGAVLSPLPLLPDAPAGTLAKKVKPDLEALLDAGGGALLAIGSGSRPNRERAFRVEPATGATRAIGLSPLYAVLRERLGELNIEGATRWRDQVVLANRGNGRGRSHALILLDGAACLDPAVGAWDAAALRTIVPLPLPALDGVPLGITDLAVHPTRGLHFLAAAEDTDDAYLDGRCAGTVIGRFDETHAPVLLARLRPDLKAEGLAWWPGDGDGGRWLIVTDADDPERLSPLFELDLPGRARGAAAGEG